MAARLRPLADARRINRTGRRAFDRLARDPRVVDVWGEDDDGVWAALADGYHWDGCSCLHGFAVDDDRRLPVRAIAAQMMEDLELVRECDAL